MAPSADLFTPKEKSISARGAEGVATKSLVCEHLQPSAPSLLTCMWLLLSTSLPLCCLQKAACNQWLTRNSQKMFKPMTLPSFITKYHRLGGWDNKNSFTSWQFWRLKVQGQGLSGVDLSGVYPLRAFRWAFLTVVSCVLCLNPLCLQWHTSCWIRVDPTDLIHLTSFFRVPSPNAVTSTGSSYQYRTLMIPPVSSRPACLRLPSAQSSMTHPCS